jgi:16S rRNA (cytosine967-C5)-methyltransferase
LGLRQTKQFRSLSKNSFNHMTPPARLSAAIEIIDRILHGESAELALTNWGRASRYAGSGDRNAVRDLVFAALRRKRSAAAAGGTMTGRGLILGIMRLQGTDPQAFFTGEGYAPMRPGPVDQSRLPTELEALDCPDWLEQPLRNALGDDFSAILQAMQSRARIFLRVNLGKSSVNAAVEILAKDGIAVLADPACFTALEVSENHRKIKRSEAYIQGLVELQDLSSQAVVLEFPLHDGQKVLDYCAGGGGKTLAMAALAKSQFFAHDHFAHRMKDLPDRAARAGVNVAVLADPAPFAPYDLVLCDVPCSGSGSWRRDPQGKLALTPNKLLEICETQTEILDRAAQLVQPMGVLIYATCSLLREENEDQIAAFLQRHPDWRCSDAKRLPLSDRGDGFFVAHLRFNHG